MEVILEVAVHEGALHTDNPDVELTKELMPVSPGEADAMVLSGALLMKKLTRKNSGIKRVDSFMNTVHLNVSNLGYKNVPVHISFNK